MRARVCFSTTGENTYAVRNRVSVMCQRDQNSMSDGALSGASKFGGSLMPNSRAMPMAMSL